MKKYQTISFPAASEIIEKRSRFIGTAAPVSSETEAAEFINQIKFENRDARHNVYAYLLKNGVKKCSDDGEPQGTGGVPVLQILEKSEITDCVIVVTRYFGGILLGAGGLVRAYSSAASAALSAAEKITVGEVIRCRAVFEYFLHGKITALALEYGEIAGTSYTENVETELLIPIDKAGEFENKLTEITAGAVKLEHLEILFKKI